MRSATRLLGAATACLLVAAVAGGIAVAGASAPAVTAAERAAAPPTMATTPSTVATTTTTTTCIPTPPQYAAASGLRCQIDFIRPWAADQAPPASFVLGGFPANTMARPAPSCSPSRHFAPDARIELTGSPGNFVVTCFAVQPAASITFVDTTRFAATGLSVPTALGVCSAANPATELLAGRSDSVVYDPTKELFVGPYAVYSGKAYRFRLPDLPAGRYLLDVPGIPGLPEAVLDVGPT